jgi:hypothetical protein
MVISIEFGGKQFPRPLDEAPYVVGNTSSFQTTNRRQNLPLARCHENSTIRRELGGLATDCIERLF